MGGPTGRRLRTEELDWSSVAGIGNGECGFGGWVWRVWVDGLCRCKGGKGGKGGM